MKPLLALFALLFPVDADAYQGPITNGWAMACTIIRTCNSNGECVEGSEIERVRFFVTNLALAEHDYYESIVWYEDPEKLGLRFRPITSFEETQEKTFPLEDWVINGLDSPFDYTGKTLVVRQEQIDHDGEFAVLELFEKTPRRSKDYRVRTLKCDQSNG